MKKLFIAGNWKSNKTIAETKAWASEFCPKVADLASEKERATVVVCAPFTSLSTLKEVVQNSVYPVALAGQNISKFGEGAYTGEISARMLHEVCGWVVIGHSERRKYYGETDEDLAKKTELAKKEGLNVIYCVPDDQTVVPKGADVVAYEPVWAIGTGKTDSPENANAVVASIKSKTGATVVLYGGSVNAENVASFMKQTSIDGVLPGGASMVADTFAKILRASIESTR